ncbi:zeta toxin family protein [Nocardia sp. CA-107356]|uniref:zeta toxin family protein n=1 Tax=Nocardia sp. CA-107356 TaxID=3239972 RepID=UPI003D8E475D
MLSKQNRFRLTAQPGAGKSTLARVIGDEYPSDQKPVTFDADAFRSFYPGYEEIKAHNSRQDEDAIVLADARRWFEMTFDYLTDMGANVIAETGLRPEVTDRYLNVLTTEKDSPKLGTNQPQLPSSPVTKQVSGLRGSGTALQLFTVQNTGEHVMNLFRTVGSARAGDSSRPLCRIQ